MISHGFFVKKGLFLNTMIGLSVAILGGLLLSRLAKLLHLPAVTAYLVAGLLLGPFCLGKFGLKGLGFSSLEQVGVGFHCLCHWQRVPAEPAEVYG